MNTYKLLAQVKPGTTTTPIYAPGTSISAIIKNITITNPTGAAHTVQLSQNSNVILPTVSIGAGEWAMFDGTLTITNPDSITGICDTANALIVSVYGVEKS